MDAAGHVHATARQHLWLDLAIVGVVSILVQVTLLLTAPGILKFPDTADYVINLAYPDTWHASDLAYVWWAGTFGIFTTTSVAVLQMVLGVLAGLALVDGLRRLTPRWVALSCALLFVCFVPLVAFERVLLSESICADLVVLSIWSMIRISAARSRPAVVVWAAVTACSLSLLVVIRPALLLGVIPVLGISLLLTWRHIGRRWALRATAIGLCLILFALPVTQRADQNRRYFGQFTLTPASTGYLLARWAPLIPCPAKQQHLTLLARAALQGACKVDAFETPPGRQVDQVFRDRRLRMIGPYVAPRNSEARAEVAAVVRRSMLANPGAVATEVAKSFWYQAFGVPVNDSVNYRAAVFDPEDLKHGERRASQIALFKRFFNHTGEVNGSAKLRSLVVATDRWPQFLGWADLFLGVLLGVLAISLRRRPSWSWFTSTRALMVLAAICFIVGEMLNIAIGAYPVFRYTYPLVPWFITVLAIELAALWGLRAHRRTLRR